MKTIILVWGKLNLLRIGILGFIGFFSAIVVSKLFTNFFASKSFSIGIDDLLISSLGFFLAIIVKIIEKFSNFTE
ncbi:MAG: hypothetical protein IPK06_04565 [Ignavibacteriae bacterium]|nr:hypothetical protein [Ignavibacteriota bacterium]